MVAHQMLQVPYEIMSISITLFVGGLGVYLGSAWARGVDLGAVPTVRWENVAILAAFIASTGFACAVFGFFVGQKALESQRCSDILEMFIGKEESRERARGGEGDGEGERKVEGKGEGKAEGKAEGKGEGEIVLP